MHPFMETQKEYLREGLPQFRPGDTLRVNVRVREGDKERIQAFEGVCIARKHGGVHETFKVRKISGGVGVERTFRCTPRCSRASRWFARAAFAAPSCTTCATCAARRRVSRAAYGASRREVELRGNGDRGMGTATRRFGGRVAVPICAPAEVCVANSTS
jgi:hypothetical protein